MANFLEGPEVIGDVETEALARRPGGVRTAQVRTIADLAAFVGPSDDSVNVQGKASDHGLIALAVATFEKSPRPFFWRLGPERRPFKICALGAFELGDDVRVVVTFARLKDGVVA